MDAESADEVVFETDVYLSKTLSENLYLFLYPTTFNDIPDEDVDCLSAKVKPNQQKVELEMGININSVCYDKGKGEMIAYSVAGKNAEQESFFKESTTMDKFTLYGNKSMGSSGSFALGVINEGSLHLTPIHSLIELSPDIIHIDKMDTQSKKALNQECGDDDEEEETVAVTMRFEGPNADRERRIREKSYQFLQQRNASEAWAHVQYHTKSSDMSASQRKKLICQSGRDLSSSSFPPQDYRTTLLPEALRLSGCDEEEDTLLDAMALSDQVKRLMTSAHALTFSMLMNKLPPDTQSMSVERLLPQAAVMIQGCWVVKSEMLYNEESVSPVTGISSKFLINARDYVLWLFTKSRFISRKDVLSTVYITDADFKDMIVPIAKEVDRKWEFKFPYDEDFVKSHPSIHQSQEMKWDARYNKLVKDFGASEIEGDPSRSSRPRHKRISRSSMSEGDESDKEGRLTKRPYSPKKRYPSGPQSKTSKQPPYATLDVSPTYLETDCPDDVKAELRDYVNDVMRAQFCMSLTELTDLVTQSPLNDVAKRPDFEKLLEEALVESGSFKVKNKWPEKTTPEVLYAFTKFGNKLDRYRAALLNMFTIQARFRQNLLSIKVKDALREIITEGECRQVIEEYCVYKSGYHYLKGTIPNEF